MKLTNFLLIIWQLVVKFDFIKFIFILVTFIYLSMLVFNKKFEGGQIW